jgi:hypothetical protein
VEKEFQEDRKKIRESFFEKYRHEVCLREKMFNDFFKEELQGNEDSSTIFSFTKSKIKDKPLSHHSKSKSHKKAKTEINFPMKEIDKDIDNLTTI